VQLTKAYDNGFEARKSPVHGVYGCEELVEGVERVLVVDGRISLGLDPGSDLQSAVCPSADVPAGHGVEVADGGAGAVDATLLVEGLRPA
jgi:hypothetical protein